MLRRVGEKVKKVIIVVFTALLVWAFLDYVKVTVKELGYIIIHGFIALYLYTFFHEMIHCMIAKLFSMKRIYFHAFHIRYYFSNKELKLSKKIIYHENFGSSFCLPEIYTTNIQWLFYVMGPLFIYTIIVVSGCILKHMVFINSVIFNIYYYVGILIYIWSLIPMKGTDIFYLYLYLFKRKDFEVLLKTRIYYNYQIYSQHLCDEIEGCLKKSVKQIKNQEIKEDYLEAILIIMAYQLHNKIEISKWFSCKELEEEFRKMYYESGILYKCNYLFYLYVKGENINKIVEMYYDFEKELNDSEECVSKFLHILVGKDKELERLERKVKEEIRVMEEMGVKDAFRDITSMYIENAKLYMNNREEINER